ncbi:hypothetical protein OAE97_03885 [Verrucomicrobia bacterium]|jgi:hypothetical protein|nr:hypothetical protein [Verrucomicrobiota bacterium]
MIAKDGIDLIITGEQTGSPEGWLQIFLEKTSSEVGLEALASQEKKEAELVSSHFTRIR